MRVARIITRMNRGGPARTLIAIAPFLRDAGVQQVVWTGVGEPGEDDLVDEARAAGMEVRVLPSLGRPLRPRSDLRAWRALAREVASFQPDLLHTHTFKAGLLGRTLPLPGAVPRVHTYHGHLFEGVYPAAVSSVLVLAERRLARRCRGIFAVSERIRHDLCERYEITDRHRVRLLPGTVGAGFGAPRDRDRARRDCGLDPTRRLVGCLARLSAVKAPERFLAMAQELIRHRPDVDCLWIGDGPLRARFERQIVERGLVGRVRRLDWKPQPTDWHAALDVEVLLSDAEGLPLSLVEARAMEVPVVATDVGGVRDLVRDGIDGHIVARDDLAATVARVGGLLDDPEQARRMGRLARQHDGLSYHPQTHTRRLVRAYRDWTARPERPGSGELVPVRVQELGALAAGAGS